MVANEPVWAATSTWKLATAPLGSNRKIDIAIVGAGLQGLSTAVAAARLGLSVQVVDAGTIGGGASGRNGGQVIPGLKYDPETLIAMFGEKAGGSLVSFVAGTADSVFDLIDAEALDVPYTRSGWIQACHTEKAMEAATSRYRQWKAQGADVDLLDASRIRQLVGTENYLGGYLDRRAGVVQPLALTRELARIALASGAAIALNTRCVRLERNGASWRLQMNDGLTLEAAKVLLATNAYSDRLIPGLAESMVALHSFQIATEPLTAEQTAGILPEGQAVSDSRRILVYYRRTPDNRLILGGRGPMAEPRSEADWRHLERALRRLFPQLEKVRIEKRWFGRVAMTPDHMPHIHEPEPGLLAVAGCQGRGVALMTALGPHLARYLATGDTDALPLPVNPIKPIPFHRFRKIGVGALIGWYRLLDALDT